MIAPCRDCNNKGCGVYHDECPEYQKYCAFKREIEDIHLKVSEANRSNVESAIRHMNSSMVDGSPLKRKRR